MRARVPDAQMDLFSLVAPLARRRPLLIMVARLARRLARGGRFGGLDAPPLALLGGPAFGLGARRPRPPLRTIRRLPASVGSRRARPRLARPGPAHVVGGVGLHLDGELGLRYAAAAAFVTQRVRAVREGDEVIRPIWCG